MAALASVCHGSSPINPYPFHALTTDPINTINGNIALDKTDLAVACPTFDLMFARAYNNEATASITPIRETS